jgi:extradiol dioxygenase family protein
MNKSSFHLSLKVLDLDKTKTFYSDVLKGKVTYESPDGWFNIEVFGHQLTFHVDPSFDISTMGSFHWGFNLSQENFEELASIIENSSKCSFVMKPSVLDEGTSQERRKMTFKDPSGYLIEVKFLN